MHYDENQILRLYNTIEKMAYHFAHNIIKMIEGKMNY